MKALKDSTIDRMEAAALTSADYVKTMLETPLTAADAKRKLGQGKIAVRMIIAYARIRATEAA